MAQFRAGSGDYQAVRSITIDPSNIPAFSTSIETFNPATIADLDNDSQVRVEMPSIETGVRILNSRLTAAGVLEITFENFTNAAVNPASQSAWVLVL